jgi:hypothetical protein
MSTLRFDPLLIVQEAREALEALPFSLEDWLGERCQEFTDFEDLDQPARDDAFYSIGRLKGAAEACGLTTLELIDLATDEGSRSTPR